MALSLLATLVREMIRPKIDLRIRRECVTFAWAGGEMTVPAIVHIVPENGKIAAVGEWEGADSDGAVLVRLFDHCGYAISKANLLEGYFRYVFAKILRWWNFPPQVMFEMDAEIECLFPGYSDFFFHVILLKSGARKTNYSKLYGDAGGIVNYL